MQANAEQATLKFSIALTVLLGVLGVASGIITGSQAIIFDGMYSFVDVVPTVVSLLVVKLIARGTSQRFQFGYWHLEPLVGVLRNSILVVACIYAAIDAVNTLASGGHDVEYGLAALWAGILCGIGLAMTLFLSRRAKALQSPMLKLDARSWLVSAFLSLALLLGFGIATALTGTPLQGWIPYLDAIALLSMALIMLPMPLIGLWRSMSDVLQVAPDELDTRVHTVMDSIVKERGFLEYSSYIAKAGRGRFVEIHVLVSPESRIDTATADAIRRDVAKRLDAATPNFWLTIDFTADRGWL
ncbi:MAG TPA: cation diffusion facilitator family transporter [Steroidobacteraceae bacterium]|nr:cation diffusion facilitator family transporter [Steroidobacteraceae bacterium]